MPTVESLGVLRRRFGLEIDHGAATTTLQIYQGAPDGLRMLGRMDDVAYALKLPHVLDLSLAIFALGVTIAIISLLT